MKPVEIAELWEICPELSGLEVEELVIQQASALLYHENNKFKEDQIFDYSGLLPVQEREYSYTANIQSQLAMDEAFARAWELADDFQNLYVSDSDVSSVDGIGSTIGETSEMGERRNVREDPVDPDEMTYEERQQLGDSVGSVSTGLPANLISQLPTFKFKSKSKKKSQEKEQCVICCEDFENGEKLTTLPCLHRYHSNCIAGWFQMNSHCPFCKTKVVEEKETVN